MTDAQLRDLVVSHLRQTTVSYRVFDAKRRAGDYPNNGADTHWGKALAALEQISAAAAATGRRACRVVYFSAVTDYACERFAKLGPAYTALLSADLNLSKPGEAYYVTDQQIATLRSGHGKVGAWGDCSATPWSAVQRYADQPPTGRGLDFATGQFENDGEWDAMIAGGCTFGIGNPANLHGGRLEKAIDLVAAGKLALIGEVLSPDPTYSAQGIDIDSACYYVDRDAKQGGYCPLVNYEGHPAEQRRTCSVYTGGRMTGQDWDLFAAWTRP